MFGIIEPTRDGGDLAQIDAVATALGSRFIAAFGAGITFRTVAANHAKEATFLG